MFTCPVLVLWVLNYFDRFRTETTKNAKNTIWIKQADKLRYSNAFSCFSLTHKERSLTSPFKPLLIFLFSLVSLGYLRCAPNNRDLTIDNGDVHENIDRRKIDFASFNFSAIIPSRPDTEKKGIYVGAEERDGKRDGDARIYSLAVPVLHWVPEAFFSRASGSFVSSAEGRRHERRSFLRGPLLKTWPKAETAHESLWHFGYSRSQVNVKSGHFTS